MPSPASPGKRRLTIAISNVAMNIINLRNESARAMLAGNEAANRECDHGKSRTPQA